MLKCVVVDYSPKAHQQTYALFALDRCPASLTHDPVSRSVVCPDRPSDCALLRINFGHLKHETTTNELLSMRLGDEAVF